MIVRRAEPEEWERLRAFRLRALASDPLAFGATLEQESEEPPDQWRARVFDASRATFVAEEGDAWLGMLGGQVKEGERELWGMWVAPEARGRGAGDALVDAGVRWAREQGAPHVILWVNLAQTHAHRLYARAGFREVGEPWRSTRDPRKLFQKMRRDLE